jgi:hypothetical protein
MAAVTHRVATAATTNASSYASGSFTPAVGDLLVGMVVASGTKATSPTFTANAGAITFKPVAAAPLAASVDTMYLFVAEQLVSSAVSMTATFTCTQDAATGAVVMVASVSGMARTGLSAVRQLETAMNVAAGTPALSFPAACLTGNPTIGLIGNATNPAGLTPPTSWTEPAGGDTGYNTPPTGAEYVYRDSGFTGTTVTWGSSSASAYGGIIIELDTSAVPASPAWSLVGTPTTNLSATARTTTTLTPPSGTAADDYLFAYIGGSIITGTGVTPPDGTWTELDAETSNTAAFGHLFVKKLTGAASGTYAFTHNSTVTTGAMWAVRGLDTTTVLDRTIQAGDFITDQTIPYTVPGITTATNGAMLLTVISTEWSGSRWITAPPAGYSEIVREQATANTTRVGIHYRQWETAGTVPATEYHLSTDATRSVVGQFAFKPAAAGTYADMHGDGAIALTGTGAITNVVPLSASSAIALTGTAAAQVVVPLAASGSVGVTGTGTLRILYANMSAQGSVALAGSASLGVVVPLSGSGTIGVAGSGAASVVVPLSASGNIALNGTGVLSVAGGPVDIAGQGTVALSGTGAMQVVVPMVGAGTVALAGVGNLQPKRALVGAGAVELAGTGALEVVVPLAGVGTFTLSGTSAMDVLVPMSAAGTVAVSGTGILSIAGAVVAADLALTHAGTAALTIGHAIGSSAATSTQAVRTAVAITHARIEQ